MLHQNRMNIIKKKVKLVNDWLDQINKGFMEGSMKNPPPFSLFCSCRRSIWDLSLFFFLWCVVFLSFWSLGGFPLLLSLFLFSFLSFFFLSLKSFSWIPPSLSINCVEWGNMHGFLSFDFWGVIPANQTFVTHSLISLLLFLYFVSVFSKGPTTWQVQRK